MSGIGDALAELPLALGPLSLEPRLALAGKELGDYFRLLIVDTAAIGAPGFHQKRRVAGHASQAIGSPPHQSPQAGKIGLGLRGRILWPKA